MEELNRFIKSNPDVREMIRALAVKFALKKYSYEWISQELMVSYAFISKWKKAFEEKGVEGLQLRYQGSVSYLNAEVQQEIVEWIKQQPHLSINQLKQYIADNYQVIYKSERSYYDLLHAGGKSWKKTQKVNPKADAEQVAKKSGNRPSPVAK